MFSPEAELRILERARQIIDKPENWTVNVFATDERGWPCDTSWPIAKAFCVMGAALRACHELGFSSGPNADWDLRHGAMRDVLVMRGYTPRSDDPASFNNTHAHEAVLQLLDDAIALLRARPELAIQEEIAAEEATNKVATVAATVARIVSDALADTSGAGETKEDGDAEQRGRMEPGPEGRSKEIVHT